MITEGIKGMKYWLALLFISLFFYTSCNLKKETQKPRTTALGTQVYEINFEECIENTKELLLSEIADTIEYLQLKTPKGIVISSIRKVLLVDEYIYVVSKGVPYQFHRNGTFIQQIGSKGRGPGEYNSAENISVDKSNGDILVYSTYRILHYKSDGNFSHSSNEKNWSTIKTDSVIWSVFPDLGIFKHQAIAFNQDQDTLATLPNYRLYESKNGDQFINVKSKYQRKLYDYNNEIFFKGTENNDSIWQLKLPKPELHAVINMGKYKLPTEYMASYSYTNFTKHAKDYYGVPRIVEDERYFYFIAQPRRSDKFVYLPMVYDKTKGTGFIVKKDTILGVTDDILHGPAFWPFFSSDGYLIGAIEAYELMEKQAEIKSKPLRKLVSTLNENSNQLLILCKKKKNGNETTN